MIGKQIEEENEKAKNFLDRKNHFIALLEQKIDERFKQEAQIREEIGNKLISVIEDKFNSLKIEISKESGNRFECIENLKSYLENDVPKLNEMLNNEKIKREEGDDSLDKKTTEEIMKVQDVISSDKKNREQTEEAILEMQCLYGMDVQARLAACQTGIALRKLISGISFRDHCP